MSSSRKRARKAKDHDICVPTPEDHNEFIKLMVEQIKRKKKKSNKKKKDKTASISHFEDNDVSSGVCGLNTTTDITFNISENNESHSSLLHNEKKKKKKKKKKVVEVGTWECPDIPRKKAKHKKQKLSNEIDKDNLEENIEKCIPIVSKEKNQNQMYKSKKKQTPIEHLNENASSINFFNISNYEELASFPKSTKKKKKKKKANKEVTQIKISSKKLIKSKKRTMSDVNQEEYVVENTIVADAVKNTNDEQTDICGVSSTTSAETSLLPLKKHNKKSRVKIQGNVVVTGATSKDLEDSLECSLILNEIKKRTKKSKKKTIQDDAMSSKIITKPIHCKDYPKYNVVPPDILAVNIKKRKHGKDNNICQNVVDTDIDTSKHLENDAINMIILKELNKRKTKSNKGGTLSSIKSPKKPTKHLESIVYLDDVLKNQKK